MMVGIKGIRTCKWCGKFTLVDNWNDRLHRFDYIEEYKLECVNPECAVVVKDKTIKSCWDKYVEYYTANNF